MANWCCQLFGRFRTDEAGATRNKTRRRQSHAAIIAGLRADQRPNSEAPPDKRRRAVKPVVEEVGDAYLLRGIIAGDEAALERAYGRYAADVFASARRKLCNARLAEDVVQHIFIALWHHPERFDPARGTLRAYLLMLANSHSIDLIRSESARRHRETLDGMAVAETDDDPQALFFGAHEVDSLRRAIDLLSEREREAIELAFFQGYTYREVAVLLNQPEGTVKSRIRLGLNRLRSAMVE